MTVWNGSSYTHWGTSKDDGSLEPNNKEPPEDCAVANYTQSYSDIFGWSDTRCEKKFIFICRLIRGWHLPLLAAHWLAWPGSKRAHRRSQQHA